MLLKQKLKIEIFNQIIFIKNIAFMLPKKIFENLSFFRSITRVNKNFKSLSKQLCLKKPCFNKRSNLYLRQKYSFSAVSIKDMKITFDPSKKTQIISLNQQQLQQLASITTYMTSISFLQKNDLQKSLEYLNYSLNEARSNYPESINLHMCLLNRRSILHKLLSQNQEFVSTLEQIFLMGQSLKGLKNLDTQKHLKNFLLSLLFNDRQKMSSVIQFVQNLEEIINSPKLQKKIPDFVFFDAISDILVRNQAEKGLEKLQTLNEETFKEKYFKTNNLAWMTLIDWKAKCKTDSQFVKKVKDEGESLLKKYLRALFDMEYCVPEQIPQKAQQTQPKNSQFIELLKGYLVGNIKQLRFIPDRAKLAHPQSHIVTMNIANLLFESQRLQECVYFMKLSLSAALDLGEVERVGLCLLLLARISFKGAQNYQQILLGLLQNSKSYPTHIIKECLSLYSQFLFKEARYIEAENYANQMMKLEGDIKLEGLLLPEYDFSF